MASERETHSHSTMDDEKNDHHAIHPQKLPHRKKKHPPTNIHSPTISTTSNIILKELGDNDVMLGRGTGPNEHVGNLRFRAIVRDVLKHHCHGSGRSTTAGTGGCWNADTKNRVAHEIVAVVKGRNGSFVQRPPPNHPLVAALNGHRNNQSDHDNDNDVDDGRQNHYQQCCRLVQVVDDKAAIQKTKQAFRHQLRIQTNTTRETSSMIKFRLAMERIDAKAAASSAAAGTKVATTETKTSHSKDKTEGQPHQDGKDNTERLLSQHHHQQQQQHQSRNIDVETTMGLRNPFDERIEVETVVAATMLAMPMFMSGRDSPAAWSSMTASTNDGSGGGSHAVGGGGGGCTTTYPANIRLPSSLAVLGTKPAYSSSSSSDSTAGSCATRAWQLIQSLQDGGRGLSTSTLQARADMTAAVTAMLVAGGSTGGMEYSSANKSRMTTPLMTSNIAALTRAAFLLETGGSAIHSENVARTNHPFPRKQHNVDVSGSGTGNNLPPSMLLDLEWTHRLEKEIKALHVANALGASNCCTAAARPSTFLSGISATPNLNDSTSKSKSLSAVLLAADAAGANAVKAATLADLLTTKATAIVATTKTTTGTPTSSSPQSSRPSLRAVAAAASVLVASGYNLPEELAQLASTSYSVTLPTVSGPAAASIGPQ